MVVVFLLNRLKSWLFMSMCCHSGMGCFLCMIIVVSLCIDIS